jgi:regulatory protein SWI6
MVLTVIVLNSYLQQANMQFTQEARIKQDTIDRTNDTITQLSAQQKAEQARLEALRTRTRTRQDRASRIMNLRRWIEMQRHNISIHDPASLRDGTKRSIGHADIDGAGLVIHPEQLPELLRTVGESVSRKASEGEPYLSTPIPLDLVDLAHTNKQQVRHLPQVSILRHRLQAYIEENKKLAERSKQLKERDGELETMYRKVVSLCTKVEEEKIDEVLEGLVQALESDPLDGVEVGRVREFLRKVDSY